MILLRNASRVPDWTEKINPEIMTKNIVWVRITLSVDVE
jgi:hypothetical protein